MSIYSEAYQKHMNLKLAASEIGIPWQTLYVYLKREGIAVTGDKLKYGSDRDRLAAMAETKFLELVPHAKPMNAIKWQSKYDFEAGFQKVDVKAAKPHQPNKRYPGKCWSFSLKKQSLICDFIVCFCFEDDGKLAHCILVPSEFFSGLQTVSVSCSGYSKWLDYKVDASTLADFFSSIEH